MSEALQHITSILMSFYIICCALPALFCSPPLLASFHLGTSVCKLYPGSHRAHQQFARPSAAPAASTLPCSAATMPAAETQLPATKGAQAAVARRGSLPLFRTAAAAASEGSKLPARQAGVASHPCETATCHRQSGTFLVLHPADFHL